MRMTTIAAKPTNPGVTASGATVMTGVGIGVSDRERMCVGLSYAGRITW